MCLKIVIQCKLLWGPVTNVSVRKALLIMYHKSAIFLQNFCSFRATRCEWIFSLFFFFCTFCCSVTQSYLTLCDLMDTRCPSPSPEVCPSSCPLSRWCHPAISSSDAPSPSALHLFPLNAALLPTFESGIINSSCFSSLHQCSWFSNSCLFCLLPTSFVYTELSAFIRNLLASLNMCLYSVTPLTFIFSLIFQQIVL